MSINNESRVWFAEFIEQNKGVVSRVDKRNVFDCNGDRYAFSLSTKGYVECRQMYEDCNKLLTIDYNTMEIYEVGREILDVQSLPNRVTVKGVKAFTAKAPFSVAVVSKFKI